MLEAARRARNVAQYDHVDATSEAFGADVMRVAERLIGAATRSIDGGQAHSQDASR